VKWLEKDMGLMIDSVAELGVPAPLTPVSRQLFREAIEKGYGEDDICGSIRVLEVLSGCQVSAPAAKKAQ
jgi:3-hydroxyisobutyrate dehydrogenase/2-hydroxy-3-oxopropionate reductase